MPAKSKAASSKDPSSATIGSEAKLWLAADKLRNNMDAAEPSEARQAVQRRVLIEADLVDTALRDSAFPQSEAIPQVLSKAKNNMFTLSGQLNAN